MKCSVTLGLCAASVLAVASCSQNGSYRLSWVFAADATAVPESSSTACGRYYVDSISATGTDDAGDAQQIVALCTPGWVTANAPPGTWFFTVQMLDAQGAVIKSPAQTTPPEPIVADGPQVQFSVSLVPPSAGDPNGTRE
jgi:hypothetical protein